MSEFSENDAHDWLKLSVKHLCSVNEAIYYALYFSCIRDGEKFTRAFNHFRKVYKIEVENG